MPAPRPVRVCLPALLPLTACSLPFPMLCSDVMQSLPALSTSFGLCCAFVFVFAGFALLVWAYVLAPVFRRVDAGSVRVPLLCADRGRLPLRCLCSTCSVSPLHSLWLSGVDCDAIDCVCVCV